MATQVTAPELRARKGDGRPLVMVTAYDAPTARIADAAGVDLILVGDSVAMAVLGYDDTLQVTVDDLAHHTAAVARTRPSAFVVADLPWLSYHTGPADAEIPVMGHLGLTPQSVLAMGGFRVQARALAEARALVEDAAALVDAGCFAIVLEGIPDQVAALVTETVAVPTIGIGAGAACDGQVLVFHDVLGLETRVKPKFVRRYAELHDHSVAALSAWAADVRAGAFPTDAESYHLAAEVAARLPGAGPSSGDLVPSGG